MSKELLLVVDAVANEKGVPREVIFEAIEAALASAAKKRYLDQDVQVAVRCRTDRVDDGRRTGLHVDVGRANRHRARGALSRPRTQPTEARVSKARPNSAQEPTARRVTSAGCRWNARDP